MRQKAALEHGRRAVRDEAPQNPGAHRELCAEIPYAHGFRLRERGLQRAVHHE